MKMKKELITIDIDTTKIKNKGTAYYRLDDGLFEF